MYGGESSNGWIWIIVVIIVLVVLGLLIWWWTSSRNNNSDSVSRNISPSQSDKALCLLKCILTEKYCLEHTPGEDCESELHKCSYGANGCLTNKQDIETFRGCINDLWSCYDRLGSQGDDICEQQFYRCVATSLD